MSDEKPITEETVVAGDTLVTLHDKVALLTAQIERMLTHLDPSGANYLLRSGALPDDGPSIAGKPTEPVWIVT